VNAGRDVERLIGTWLVEESPGRAPDRILSNAARTIDRTNQRRFLAAWREPVSIGLRGFAAMAAVLILALIGAAWIGRSTASVGTEPSLAPTYSPSATVAGVTLAQYKAARDAICTPAINQVIALNTAAESFHPDTSPGDAGPLADNIEQVIAVASAATNALAGLTPPPTLVTEHAVDVARHRDGLAIIGEVVARLRAGDIAGANAIDAATARISGQQEAFEQKYGLAGCP
jgi:hypothetical protein